MPDTQHGTDTAYTSHGCRCDPCRAAHAAYLRRWRKQRAQQAWGTFTPWLVDPQPARDHIAKLRAAGMGNTAIAAAAEVNRHLVARLAGWTDPRRPQRHISRETESAILAVTLAEAAPGSRCDAASTIRRLQALAALGWTARDIAEATGIHFRQVYLLAAGGRESILRRTAAAVTDAYLRLHMTPGPSDLTRTRARRRGWLPPLAWDDIEAGTVGDTAVTAGCPMCDHAEELIRRGEPRDQVAMAVSDAGKAGHRVGALKKHLHQHARWDLLEALGMVQVSA